MIHERKDGHVQIISSDLQVFQNCKHLNEIDLNGSPLALPLAVLKSLGHPVSVDVFVASEVPPGTGLGSSAAVCVNTLHAMAAYLGESRTKYDLAQKAFSIVSRSFGKPIGKQDEFAVAFGNLNFLTFHADGATSVEPLQLPLETIRKLEQKLMLFFTGQARNSWTILEQQDQSVRSSNSLIVHSLHEIRLLAQEMREKLLNGALREFGLLLHQGWESKKRISSAMSNREIDRLYNIARENGALGGKITGAGGGGFMLLYCDEEYQQNVRQALARENISEMRFGFDHHGSHIVINDPSL